MTDEEFSTMVSAVNTTISEKDKSLKEEFQRFWSSEFATHAYKFDRQKSDIAMLSTVTKAELQAYFEKLFFQSNRANRLDMHWNSQLHIKRDVEGDAGEEVKEEEAKQAEESETAEEESVPTYETEKRYKTFNQFKMSMGLFVDNYKLNYVTSNFANLWSCVATNFLSNLWLASNFSKRLG